MFSAEPWPRSSLGRWPIQAASAQSVEEFYKGKTLQIRSGLASAARTTLYARVLAEHIGRHIPGNPKASS